MELSDYDIVIRNCGSVGYLGIVIISGKEYYRTGKHYPTTVEALKKCEEVISSYKEALGY